MELEHQTWYSTINNPFQEGSSSPEKLPVRVYLELEKKCSSFDRRFCPQRKAENISEDTQTTFHELCSTPESAMP